MTSPVCAALPRIVPSRSATSCRLLVTSLFHSNLCGMNLDCDLSVCSLHLHITRPPPPLIVLSSLVINLRPPTFRLHMDKTQLKDSLLPNISRSLPTSLKLMCHCLDHGPLPLAQSMLCTASFVATRMATLRHII